jgi:hypothetical protein
MRALEKNAWWIDLIADKDSLSLRQLGEKYKCTPGAITNALKRSGLTRESAPSGPRFKGGIAVADILPPMADAVAPLSKRKPERKVLRGGEISKKSIAAMQKFASVLGDVSDEVFAARVGVATKEAESFRKAAGITRFKEVKEAKKRGRTSKITPFKNFVGNTPDLEIAKMAGVTVYAIRAYRSKHGIRLTEASKRPVGRPRKNTVQTSKTIAKAPAKTVATPIKLSKNASVYTATFRTSKGDVERYVFGDSLSSAAAFATSRGSNSINGELVSITFVGISI